MKIILTVEVDPHLENAHAIAETAVAVLSYMGDNVEYRIEED